MSDSRDPRHQNLSWALFGLGLIGLLQLDLLPALLAGLLIYSLVNVLVRQLRLPLLGRAGRLLAVTLIAAVVLALFAFAILWLVGFLRDSDENIPALIQRMAEIIDSSRGRLPGWILEYVPADTAQLMAAAVTWLRSHAGAFQNVGAGLGRGLAQVVLGMVIGALLSLEATIPRRSEGPLTAALAHRALRLGLAFKRVVFAQIWISSINTLCTGLYLGAVLPFCGVDLPFTKTLIIITFIAGLLPIVGNLVSNTVIVTVSLSESVLVALGSLAFLVVIHKLEYFLNARIIGSHIRARAWELLIAMLVFEATFGLAGLIAAPIYYAYLKDELRARGLI